MITTNLIRLLVVAALASVFTPGVSHASQEAAAPPAASLPGIRVSFKLDPRITRGMYMGDRWVSPPTYSGVQAGNKFIAEARAEGLDSGRNITDTIPRWTPEDPGMVTVSPGQGREVKITVLRAGQSILTVTHGRDSRKLTVKATTKDNAIHVEISQ